MKPRVIEVRIGELVLEGFSPADGPRIGAALERELGRLFAQHGVPAAMAGGSQREVIDAGAFTHAPQATPAATGAQMARAAYGGLKHR